LLNKSVVIVFVGVNVFVATGKTNVISGSGINVVVGVIVGVKVIVGEGPIVGDFVGCGLPEDPIWDAVGESDEVIWLTSSINTALAG